MNSSYRTYIFFLGILSFSIFFILKPPENTQVEKRNNEEVATLEVNDFTLLSVADNKLELKVVGKRGMQFEDREEFWDFSLVNYNPSIGGLKALKSQSGVEETFYAHHGIQKADFYLFEGGVKYQNAEGIIFEALNGEYFMKEKIFKTKGEFEFQTQDGIFKGLNLHYDGISQEIDAQSPKGKIWLED